LHRAAQFIVREYEGTLPRTAEELHKLPGVGDYTAAAIASIAFGEPIAVVDGNVQRVILRLFAANGNSSPQGVRHHANALLDPERAGDFNQSMMELGATLCLPKNPLCLSCPVQAFCSTRGEHAVEPRKQMRSQQIAYALLRRTIPQAHQVMLEQRPMTASLMPGMWELPEVKMEETDHDRVELTVRHAITVTNYYVRILRFSEREAKRRLRPAAEQRKWVRTSELHRLPLTGLTRKVLKRLKIMPRAEVIV
jgi:A/G-specific adenine glycosylase